jgi:hypothetical protein
MGEEEEEEEEDEDEDKEEEDKDGNEGSTGGNTSSKHSFRVVVERQLPHLKGDSVLVAPPAICSTHPRQKQWRQGSTTGCAGFSQQQKAHGRPTKTPLSAQALFKAALVGAKARRFGWALTSERAASRESLWVPSTTPTTDDDEDDDKGEEEAEDEEAEPPNKPWLPPPSPPMPPLMKTDTVLKLTQPAKEAARRSCGMKWALSWHAMISEGEKRGDQVSTFQT